VADPTAFQLRLMALLAKLPNQHGSTSELAVRLGTSRVAVVSACRSLERAGWALTFRSGSDRWAAQMWAPTAAWRARGVALPAPDLAALLREAADRIVDVGGYEHRGDSIEDVWTQEHDEPYNDLADRLRAAAGVAPCDLCAKGFPVENGQHHGTQALGMIPATPCTAGVVGLDGKTFPPNTPAPTD
jgi:hypothetical protein